MLLQCASKLKMRDPSLSVRYHHLCLSPSPLQQSRLLLDLSGNLEVQHQRGKPLSAFEHTQGSAEFLVWLGCTSLHAERYEFLTRRKNSIGKPEESFCPVCSCSTLWTTSQCQNTMSPGLTVGTEVMLSSNLMWGWLACVRRGPKKPLSPAKIPGKSGVEISGTDR